MFHKAYVVNPYISLSLSLSHTHTHTHSLTHNKNKHTISSYKRARCVAIIYEGGLLAFHCSQEIASHDSRLARDGRSCLRCGQTGGITQSKDIAIPLVPES